MLLDSDLELLRHRHADQLGHSGGSLLEHLAGTAALLSGWGLPPHVVRAGLFHSVYGTEAYTQVPPLERGELAARIGNDAEAIVHLFCTLDRGSLYANAGRDGDYAACCRYTGRSIALDPQTVRALFHVASANWLEQRPRLAPAHAAASGAAYRRMLPFLEPAARAALEPALAETHATTLTALFAFDDAAVVDAQCGALDVRYLGAMSHRLQSLVGGELAARLDALPDDDYLALLRASETCYHALCDRDALPAYLDGALGGATHGTPLAGGWIVADFDGPAARRPLTQLAYKAVPFGPAEAFTEAERACVVDKLGGALAGIDRASPVATRFLRYTLHAIIPRKQTRPDLYPNSFKGSSTAATIHRANMYNVQQANVDTARVAQSILHEAVHNHLYKREQFEPTLVDLEAGEALRVTSPWSGNTLDLYVFVHSSMVYYALHRFFARPAAAAHLPADTVAWFRGRAVKGFASDAWARLADTHGALIAPDVLRDLWAMRAIVAADGDA